MAYRWRSRPSSEVWPCSWPRRQSKGGANVAIIEAARDSLPR